MLYLLVGFVNWYIENENFGDVRILVDIANGHISKLHKLCKKFVKNKKDKNHVLMVGNIANPKTYKELAKIGVDYVRVGIGSGQQCTTREVTGIGCPQITAISNCVLSEDENTAAIISDGGIRSAADVMKAIAFGADHVMIGSLFGSALELDNEYIYGTASKRLQEEYYHNVRSVEGRVTHVNDKRPLQEIISNLFWNIKSACTYLNISNLKSDSIYFNTKAIKINRSSLKNV